MSHESYMKQIENMPPETPEMFGMHSNVEIGFRLARSEQVVKSMQLLQPGLSLLAVLCSLVSLFV